MLTALLTHLRNRPWLVGCLLLMVSGVSTVVTSQAGYLPFWSGIIFMICSLLAALRVIRNSPMQAF